MSGKKNTRVEPEEQEEELTVFVMRFKGTGETMRKGFDTVSQALQAMGPAQMIAAPPRVLRRLNADVLPAAGADTMEEAELVDVDEEISESEEAAAAPLRPAKKQERKPPKIPNLINDLDYQSPVSLADYVKERIQRALTLNISS